MSAENRLNDLGFNLTEPNAPAANYIPVSRTGNVLFVSGQISMDELGVVTGKLGDNLEVADGQRAAALSAVSILNHIVFSAGVPLDEVKRVLKLTVLVASAPDFYEHHLVANGASDLLVEVLGENGRHARAAFGVAALPLGAAVEIEAMVEV